MKNEFCYFSHNNFAVAGNASQAPVQVNPQTGQPDYSAQWAEYYRSLGMHREAEMIEQQAKQGKQDNQQGGKNCCICVLQQKNVH